MKRCFLLLIISIGFVTTSFSQGINLFFMSDQPITEFSEEDMELFRASVLDVLENKQENETLNWENPNTDTKGQIKLLNISSFHGLPCKTVELKNSTKNIVGSVYTYKACKQQDTWQILPLDSN